MQSETHIFFFGLRTLIAVFQLVITNTGMSSMMTTNEKNNYNHSILITSDPLTPHF
jgi:hypothetical protein